MCLIFTFGQLPLNAADSGRPSSRSTANIGLPSSAIDDVSEKARVQAQGITLHYIRVI